MRKALFLSLAALAALGCERRERDTSREQLREGAGEVTEGARELGGEMREGAGRVAEETREMGGEMREEAGRAAEETREMGGEMRERWSGPAMHELTPSERAELETAAKRDNYDLSFGEDGKITATKKGAKQPVAGQELSDAEIESALRARLQGQPGAEAIQVDAQNGIVTLSGDFAAFSGKSKAISLALDNPGVEQVVVHVH